MADDNPVEVTPEEEETPKKEEENKEGKETIENKDENGEGKNDEPDEDDKKEDEGSENEKSKEDEGDDKDEKEEAKEEVTEDLVVESKAVESLEESGATAPEEEEENNDKEDEATEETKEDEATEETKEDEATDETKEDEATDETKEEPLDPDRVKTVFNVFQKDDAVPVSEIGSMIRSLGFNPLDEEVDEIIKPFTEDALESIDFDTFNSLVEAEKEKRKDIDEDQRFKEAFEIFDKEKTGKISKTELKEVLTTMGSMKLSEEESDDVIGKLEFDEEENISHEAIIELLRS